MKRDPSAESEPRGGALAAIVAAIAFAIRLWLLIGPSVVCRCGLMLVTVAIGSAEVFWLLIGAGAGACSCGLMLVTVAVGSMDGSWLPTGADAAI